MQFYKYYQKKTLYNICLMISFDMNDFRKCVYTHESAQNIYTSNIRMSAVTRVCSQEPLLIYALHGK